MESQTKTTKTSPKKKKNQRKVELSQMVPIRNDIFIQNQWMGISPI